MANHAGQSVVESAGIIRVRVARLYQLDAAGVRDFGTTARPDPGSSEAESHQIGAGLTSTDICRCSGTCKLGDRYGL